ncbi:MAG: polysaccharide biosynthesis C-terminal domain-containing protein, partial [Candidatus Levybacteria bacterium]|nr:polysaccharide biosynthesis C-terminal domain-containing protein [Candidatus Levybacteria bacterium]
FFGAFSDIGFHITIINEMNKKTASSLLFGTYLWIKVAISIFSFLIPVAVLIFFPYSSFEKTAIMIGAIAFGIGNLIGYGNTFLQSKIKLDVVTYIDVINKVITVGLISLFVYLKLNLFIILTSVLIGNTVSLFLTFISIKNYVSLSLEFDKKLALKLTKISLPVGIASILSFVYFRLDTIILSVIKGSREVGIYSLSYRIFENFLIFWSFYVASFYPLLSKYYNADDLLQYKSLLKNSIILALGFGLFIIFVGFIFSPFLVKILGGDLFFESVLPLKILLFAALFFFINNLLYYVFFIKKRSDILVKSLVISLGFNLISNLFLIPKYGYIGASFSTIATEIFLFGLYFFAFKRINGFLK